MTARFCMRCGTKLGWPVVIRKGQEIICFKCSERNGPKDPGP